VNLGSVEDYLDDDPKRPSTFEFADRIRPFLASLPDATLSVQAVKTSFSRGKPLQIVVTGEDTNTLNQVAGEVMKGIRSVPGVVDVDLDWRIGRPELAMDPIRWRMGRLGADAASVSSNVRGYITGLEAGKYREGGLEYDILVKMEPERTKSVFSAPDLPVMTALGSVPLKELTRFSYEAGPTRIVRKDRIRSVTVEADVVGRTVGEAFQEIRQGLKELSVPPGYSVKYEGDVEAMQETFRDMGIAFGLAVAITFLMIAAILESWAFAFIIILTVPLSAIGVIPAMVATNTAVSLYALMGLVMLVGLVVNNAIVIVDFAEGLRRSGEKAAEAIVEACRVRFRSILMADLTSIFAMIPLALGMGEGGALRAPMAVVAIGGLFAGGGLALFVIPPVYRLFWERREKMPVQRRGRWREVLLAFLRRPRD
jgi:HAE1 family hydrophobic/amphiphilic exporter-1